MRYNTLAFEYISPSTIDHSHGLEHYNVASRKILERYDKGYKYYKSIINYLVKQGYEGQKYKNDIRVILRSGDGNFCFMLDFRDDERDPKLEVLVNTPIELFPIDKFKRQFPELVKRSEMKEISRKKKK